MVVVVTTMTLANSENNSLALSMFVYSRVEIKQSIFLWVAYTHVARLYMPTLGGYSSGVWKTVATG